MRAAAFLLIKDSKASYAIKGKNPPQNRQQHWGNVIGQAGRVPRTCSRKSALIYIPSSWLIITSSEFSWVD